MTQTRSEVSIDPGDGYNPFPIYVSNAMRQQEASKAAVALAETRLENVAHWIEHCDIPDVPQPALVDNVNHQAASITSSAASILKNFIFFFNNLEDSDDCSTDEDEGNDEPLIPPSLFEPEDSTAPNEPSHAFPGALLNSVNHSQSTTAVSNRPAHSISDHESVYKGVSIDAILHAAASQTGEASIRAHSISDAHSVYFSARSIFSSLFSDSTGFQSQNGATWKEELTRTMNSGFGAGAPRTQRRPVMEGRERGGYLPPTRGVGRLGKPPISVPEALLLALRMNSWATELKVQFDKWRVERADLDTELNSRLEDSYIVQPFYEKAHPESRLLGVKHDLKTLEVEMKAYEELELEKGPDVRLALEALQTHHRFMMKTLLKELDEDDNTPYRERSSTTATRPDPRAPITLDQVLKNYKEKKT